MRMVVALIASSLGGMAGAGTAIDVDVAEFLGCALFDKGDVYCFGQFPIEDFELPFAATKVQGLLPATKIATGRFGACAIDEDGQLWCWGLDYQRSEREQKLVTSSQPFKVDGLPPVRTVDMGYNHICAISQADDAWCWGMNVCGEVGCGHTEPVPEPTQVPYSHGVQFISAGVNNTCATFFGGELVCWGSDNPAMPGRPFIYESPEPVLLSKKYFGEMTQISNGRNFACGILRSGEVTCWGSNIMGQLGTEVPRVGEGPIGIAEVDGISKALDIDANYFNACAVDDGRVKCWGAPLFGTSDEMAQLPTLVPSITGATRVSLAPEFGCAVADGQVKCWGVENHDGEPLIEGMTPTNPVPVPGMP